MLGDMFTGDYLESTAKASTVLLDQSAFSRWQGIAAAGADATPSPRGRRVRPVLPATLLFSDKRPKQLREWLASHCQLGEVSLFPDGLFSFADQECTILLGRRLPNGSSTRSMSTRLRRVRERDRTAFEQDYRVTTSRIESQSRFAEQPDSALWIPEFNEEIWSWLRHLPNLESIAAVNQGMQHKGAIACLRTRKPLRENRFRGVSKGSKAVKVTGPSTTTPRFAT